MFAFLLQTSVAASLKGAASTRQRARQSHTWMTKRNLDQHRAWAAHFQGALTFRIGQTQGQPLSQRSLPVYSNGYPLVSPNPSPATPPSDMHRL